ncbi:MAG: hypothetical protein JXB38_02755 [Anaerolineales bacterium]|nr:hypothetical protein [Anaerolineales bacterium]
MHHLLKNMTNTLRKALNHINDLITRSALVRPTTHTVSTQTAPESTGHSADPLYDRMQARQAWLQKHADTDRLVAQARANLLRDVQNEIAASVAQLNEKNRQHHDQSNAVEAEVENAEKVVWTEYIVALNLQENRLETAFNRQVNAAARQDYPDVDETTRRMTEPVYPMPVPLPEDLVCEH